VSRGDFPTALDTIIEAKQVLDVIKGGNLINDGAVLEFAASLHCVIGQYCTRLGIHDGALAHFSMSEARSKSQGTKLHALLLKSMLVVDSPDAAAQRATDAAVLLAKADGMVKAQGDRGAGEWAISTLAYLRGKLAASSCTESEEAVAQVSCNRPNRSHSSAELRYSENDTLLPPEMRAIMLMSLFLSLCKCCR
jgi:hypothetical protein